MEKICLSHCTAFALLRYARANNYEITSVKSNNLIFCAPSIQQAREIKLLEKEIIGKTGKIDVLMPFRKNNSKFAMYHLCCASNVKKSFVKIYADINDPYKQIFDKIVLTSPEFTFLQLANKLPFFRFCQWAMEMIGNYAIDYKSDAGFVSNLDTLTNTKKILFYMQNAGKFFKSKKAKYALKWIGNESASPAETNLFLLLFGPRKQGFWQIKKFLLNHTIVLSPEAQKIYGYHKIKPDFCNLTYKIILEYDSFLHHRNETQNFRDKARIAALNHDGWTVITIIPNQILNLDALDNIAKDLLKMLGQDSRVKSKQFYINHKTAHQKVIAVPNRNQ